MNNPTLPRLLLQRAFLSDKPGPAGTALAEGFLFIKINFVS